VPIPVPVAPLAIVIQLTWLVAVHEHAVPVVTEIVPVFAVDGTDTLVVPTLYTHCASTRRASNANASAISAQQRGSVIGRRLCDILECLDECATGCTTCAPDGGAQAAVQQILTKSGSTPGFQMCEGDDENATRGEHRGAHR